MTANNKDEYMLVPLPKDEDEPDDREMEAYDGPVVDINDPQLTEQTCTDDPDGDAYARYRVMRFKKATDGSPYSASVEPS
jgi:hypothetical protein